MVNNTMEVLSRVVRRELNISRLAVQLRLIFLWHAQNIMVCKFRGWTLNTPHYIHMIVIICGE